MLVYPLPKAGQGKAFVFDVTQAGANGSWRAWVKPPCSMVSATVISGGGSGGGGFTGAAGTARGGGAGGGSSAITRSVWPAWAVPDLLYIAVGNGGAAVGASLAGNSGLQSYIALSTSTTAVNVFSTALPGNGGGAGTGAAGGTAGTAGAVSSSTSALGLNYGLWESTAGQAGSAGGAQTGAVGATVTISAGNPLTGGAGGGGTPVGNTDFAGGPINTAGVWPTLAGGVAAAGAGNNGYIYQLNQSMMQIRELQPYAALWGGVCYGGTGGGTAGASGTAGRGGNGGGWGTGGGGGGGGVTGGAGGKGGDGLIIIVCW